MSLIESVRPLARFVSHPIHSIALGGAATLIVLTACEAQDGGRETHAYEIEFLEHMLDAQAAMAEMTALCVQSTSQDALASFCEKSADTQSTQNDEMRTWLGTWYDIHGYQPRIGTDKTMSIAHLGSLEGQAFDVYFMETMIEDQEQVISSTVPCLDHAWHGELGDLCGSLLDTAERDIWTMRTWLCRWYAEC